MQVLRVHVRSPVRSRARAEVAGLHSESCFFCCVLCVCCWVLCVVHATTESGMSPLRPAPFNTLASATCDSQIGC